MSERSLLFVCRHAPYGNSLAHEALDMLMAFAVFGQPVSVLFMGAGCLQLQPQADATHGDVKNLGAALQALPLYDINEVYCDAAAMQHYQLQTSHLVVDATAVDDTQMQALISRHDRVLAL